MSQKLNENVIRKQLNENEVILPKDNEDNILITSALPC